MNFMLKAFLVLLCLQPFPSGVFVRKPEQKTMVRAVYNNERIASYDETWSDEDGDDDGSANGEDSTRTFPLTHSLRQPLRVYVETQSNPLFRPIYLKDVSDDLAEWSRALNGRLTYRFVSSPWQAQIKVHWVNGFHDPYQAGNTAYEVGHADVWIKTPGIPAREIQGNILHEFGHALGIGAHSPYSGDIMVATRHWSRNSKAPLHLSSRDKAAIQRLYSPSWQSGEDLYMALGQYQKPVLANNNPRPSYSNIGQPYHSVSQSPHPNKVVGFFKRLFGG